MSACLGLKDKNIQEKKLAVPICGVDRFYQILTEITTANFFFIPNYVESNPRKYINFSIYYRDYSHTQDHNATQLGFYLWLNISHHQTSNFLRTNF